MAVRHFARRNEDFNDEESLSSSSSSDSEVVNQPSPGNAEQESEKTEIPKYAPGNAETREISQVSHNIESLSGDVPNSEAPQVAFGESVDVEKTMAVASTSPELESSEPSDDESESSSESDKPMSRPVFKRKQAAAETVEISTDSRKSDTVERFRRAAVAKPMQRESKADDTDDIDPKQEYNDWVLRERARMKREHDRLAQIEAEYEQKMERREKRMADSSLDSRLLKRPKLDM